MSQQSLKDKTIKGTAWSAIDNVTQMGVSFLVSIVLARLLSPDDYGLLGIINIFTVVCTAIINGGFSTALIRKKDVINGESAMRTMSNFYSFQKSIIILKYQGAKSRLAAWIAYLKKYSNHF